jgi:hypothetical protein
LVFRLLASHQVFIEPFDDAGSKVDDLAFADARVWRRFTAPSQFLKRMVRDAEQLGALALIENLSALGELRTHRFFASMTIVTGP